MRISSVATVVAGLFLVLGGLTGVAGPDADRGSVVNLEMRSLDRDVMRISVATGPQRDVSVAPYNPYADVEVRRPDIVEPVAEISAVKFTKNFPLELVITHKEDKRPDPTVAVAREFGVSAEGRPLTVYTRAGSHRTTRTVLVVGVTHGQESEGLEVTERLMTAELPADLQLHIIHVLNPDGLAVAQEVGEGPLGVRGAHTATGTNLNRNFPTNWETGTFFSSSKYYSGPSPASEVETQAFMALAEELRPDVSIWYHAPWDEIDCEVERAPSCVKFAEMVDYEVHFAPRPGTATDWVMTAGLGESFVVEMGPTRFDDDTVYNKHVQAVLAVEPGVPAAEGGI